MELSVFLGKAEKVYILTVFLQAMSDVESKSLIQKHVSNDCAVLKSEALTICLKIFKSTEICITVKSL